MKTDQPQRLAPVALLIIWIRGFISWWPLFVGGGLSILRADMSFNQFLLWGGLIVGVLVLTLIWSILHYLRFTYLVAPNGLTINSGVLIRKVNHIPYDRIQTVHG
ncbi:membrane protein, partial [Lacticaseibacillus paracasei subsp. paracasei Lpp126]